MNENRQCPKCGGEMIMGTESGYFAVIEVANPRIGEMTSTNDYMCQTCGLIEIYAANPEFTKK